MLIVNIHGAETQFSKLIEAVGRGIAATDVYVSSASRWEAMIKASLGKLDVETGRLVAEISNSGFQQLAVSARHAAQVARLPTSTATLSTACWSHKPCASRCACLPRIASSSNTRSWWR